MLLNPRFSIRASICVGLFPANALIALRRLILLGLASTFAEAPVLRSSSTAEGGSEDRSPPPRAKSVEPPPLAHCMGWLQNSCFCKRPSLLKKLIAASGLDPSTYKSGKYEGKSRISKRGNRHLRRVIWLMATKVIITTTSSEPISIKEETKGCQKKWPSSPLLIN